MKNLFQIIIVVAGLISFIPSERPKEVKPYLSPTHICTDKLTGKVFISLSTASKIAVIDINTYQFERYIKLPFNPGGLVLSKDSQTLIVADKKPEGHIHFIGVNSGRTSMSIKVGHTPDAMVITPDATQAFVANRFSNSISVIDLVRKKEIKQIAVDRDPIALAISAKGDYVAVANQIPNLASTDPFVSAKVSLIDRSSLSVIENIALANGSQSLTGIAFSKDGKNLYASHILSRNKLPTTQIEHGWMNSNAISIIQVEEKKYYTSVLLDNFNRGAANPAGMSVSDDGTELYIALSGVNELGILDLPKLHKKLEATLSIDEIPNNLSFLNGIKKRISTSGISPRHVAVLGQKIIVTSYFSSHTEIFMNLAKSENSENILLGSEPKMTNERKGELLFSQADLCFQEWQSCRSCHPDARSDGLNWDLMNDGAGNPKNNKSMLYAHLTPPSMITGIRENAEIAVRAGMKFALFTEPQESDARDIDAYLMSLKPVPSPYLEQGQLSTKAILGKEIFRKAECLKCHVGQYHTDGQKYNVGTGIKLHTDDQFDVPGLSEVWRTAPYLYDGRAKTMIEVFSKFNHNDKHGITSSLSAEELDQLVEYVLSL